MDLGECNGLEEVREAHFMFETKISSSYFRHRCATRCGAELRWEVFDNLSIYLLTGVMNAIEASTTTASNKQFT